MLCCFCGSSTRAATDREYIELEMRFPAYDGPFRQWFGAHVACFDAAAHINQPVEIPFN